MHIPFILRSMTENDKSFIYNSFLKSYHDHYPAKFVPDILYYKPQSDIIDYLLTTSTCLIACFPEDPSEIAGYLLYQEVSDALVLHYIYVKNLHRWKYMATDMINQIIDKKSLIIATHMCDGFAKLKYKIKSARIVYDPYFIAKQRMMQ